MMKQYEKRLINRKAGMRAAGILAGGLLSGMLFVASIAAPAHADTLPAEDPGWYVTLNKNGKMESNFSSNKLDETIGNMQPGDEAVFRITVNNEYNDTIDWYMENDILYSLEDRSANKGTTGGGYTYRLTYTDTTGKENVLFDSDTVGGDNISEAGEGLNEVSSSLENWFLMDTMKASTTGKVELYVMMDGETQGNNYQDTLADLKLNFAVEFLETKTIIKPEIKTGDTTRILPYLILMIAAVILTLFAFILRMRDTSLMVAGSKGTAKSMDAAEKQRRAEK